MPGVFTKIPGWLIDPAGPLTIRPRYFLRALPWLTRFALAARAARVIEIANALRALHRPVYECYEPLVRAAGCADLIRRTGVLFVYRGEQSFLASRSEWRLREQCGVESRNLDSGELRHVVPELSPSYTHGVMQADHGYVADPYRLVRALAARFISGGGSIERAAARALRRSGNDTVTVSLQEGEIDADRVVIAAGAWSKELTESLGLHIPLESQRGYQVTIPNPHIEPALPVSSSEEKIYATPMESGLRVAGTVEFAGLEAAPDFQRARRLLGQLKALYPRARVDEFTEWMGHRPCLPDSMPVIGPVPRFPNVLLAFGHGHNGMTSGPVTGRLIADMVAKRTPLVDPKPYRPDRF
jgi:D-amino-acid dehydrogenase